MPVGGEGVRTVVALAEFPPLTVRLGPPPLPPVVEPAPPPLPPLAVDGADDPPDGAGAVVVLGAVVTGAVLDIVGVGVLLLGSVPLPELLQPDTTAVATAADDTAKSAARYEMITAGS